MIIKDFVTPSTGATATFHVVSQVLIDYGGSELTTATVSSFLSPEAYAAKKFPMFTQSVPLEGRPSDGQDAQAWAEGKLVEAAPDDAVSPYGNRYVLANGEIVTDTSSTETVAT